MCRGLRSRRMARGRRRTARGLNKIGRRATRWLAVVLACAYVLVTVGVLPSPAWLARHIPNFERFPCEECGCGCATAKQCWEMCCCHTDAEKLAWAMREGVKPPSYVWFSEATWIEALQIKDPGKAACTLCVQAEQDRLTEQSARRPSLLARVFESRPHTPRCGSGCTSACCADQARLSASTCGGQAEATDAATAPSCARPQDEGAAPARRGHPRLSPLRCKGVFELLIVLSHGVMHAGSGFYLAPSRVVELRCDLDKWAASRALPVEPPPPRAC